jgi:hypothetical protein
MVACFFSAGIWLRATAGKGFRRYERTGQNPVALVLEMAKRQPQQGIPTNLSVAQFEQFVLPHLSKGRRGPATKLGWHTIFNYILRLLYLGCL